MGYKLYFNSSTRVSIDEMKASCINNEFIKTKLDVKSYKLNYKFTYHFPLLLSLSENKKVSKERET